jgi:hypothetical protein
MPAETVPTLSERCSGVEPLITIRSASWRLWRVSKAFATHRTDCSAPLCIVAIERLRAKAEQMVKLVRVPSGKKMACSRCLGKRVRAADSGLALTRTAPAAPSSALFQGSSDPCTGAVGVAYLGSSEIGYSRVRGLLGAGSRSALPLRFSVIFEYEG